MYNTNIPADRELPSTGKLIKSTILAAITAGVLLVTIVMPAEYGIDPTGLGNTLGLKKMGEIKMSLAQEAAQDTEWTEVTANEISMAEAEPITADAVPISEPLEPAPNIRSDEMQVTLAPDEGTEIKVTMAKGKTVNYSWSTDGGKANFDVHADSKDIDYHGYEKGSGQTKEGVIEAAFDGNHGWFWRNRTAKTITVTLKTSGEYTDIKHMK